MEQHVSARIEYDHFDRYRCTVIWCGNFTWLTQQIEIERDSKVEEMRRWCTEEFGIASWKWNMKKFNKHTEFTFDEKAHAMLFKMRWS